MLDYATITENGEMVFERLLPGTMEDIWAMITESGKREKWLAGGEMQPRKGGSLTLIFQHSKLSKRTAPIPKRYSQYENGETMHAEVLEYESPKKLVLTWPGGSKVKFELSPREDNVLLKLTHSGLGASKAMLVSVAAGWESHLKILESVMYGMERDPFWELFRKYEKEYEEQILQ